MTRGGRTALAAVVSVLGLGSAVSALAKTAVLEPGLTTPEGGGLLPVVLLDPYGDPVPFGREEIAVEIGGSPVRQWELLPVGEAPEGAPLRVVAAVDPAALDESERDEWADALAGFLAARVTGERPMLSILGGKRFEPTSPGAAPDAERVRSALDGKPGKLWDEVLRELDRLSEPGDPERRVVLLVASGAESEPSRHPSETCVDAADRARVAIHAVAVGERGEGLARLREVARRTGGGLESAGPSSGVGAFFELLTRIRATRMIRIPRLPPDADRVTVRPGVGAETFATGTVRPRIALRLFGRGRAPKGAVAAGLLVALAAAGALAYRLRPFGRVTTVGEQPAVSSLVTRAGVSLGGSRGNTLVFDDPRISRNHAVIRVERGKVTLVDLRSSNGTTVDGSPVRSIILTGGERIRLAGAVELVYEAGWFARRTGRG